MIDLQKTLYCSVTHLVNGQERFINTTSGIGRNSICISFIHKKASIPEDYGMVRFMEITYNFRAFHFGENVTGETYLNTLKNQLNQIDALDEGLPDYLQ